jgi:large subunit ribosomal protein L18
MKRKLLTIQYRRKREGKTDYKKRLTLLKSGKPRIVVRKSQKHMLAQIISYDENGDRIIASAHSSELKKMDWGYGGKNLPASYLVGLLAGKRAAAAGTKGCILDIGLQCPVGKSRLFACLKGAVDAGLEIPHSKEIFPSEDRIKGKHIAGYKPKQDSQFSKYKKDGKAPEKIMESFEQAKLKILKV